MPLLSVIAFVLLISPIDAWNAEASPETPTLTVVGIGTVNIPPDTAFVTVGMDTAHKSLAEAQRQNSAVIQKVMERLKELKIEKERIQTSAFTVTAQYKPAPRRQEGPPPPTPEIIGYTVSNTLTVEVRDIEKVSVVIEECLAAGANHFQGLQWALRDEQQARLSALKIAAAKAREKATALSDAMTMKLGQVLNVTEGTHVVRPQPRTFRSAVATNGGGGEVPISSGEMRVEATVTVVYEIAR
jgi:uncharacterized protein YggE